jgi:hypothetical protein
VRRSARLFARVTDISGTFSARRTPGAFTASARSRCYALLAPLALIFSLVVLAAPTPAGADIAAGWQAFETGAYARADAEWRPLAEAGSRDAQFAMGILAEAHGNPAAALEWYEGAARNGQTAAQAIVGSRYALGMEVEVNLVRAWYWLDQAAQRNHPNAAEFRDSLVSRMTAHERALITQLAD